MAQHLLAIQRRAGNAATIQAAAEAGLTIQRQVSGADTVEHQVIDPSVDRPQGLRTLGYSPPVLNGNLIDENAGPLGARPHLALPTIAQAAVDGGGVSLRITAMPTNVISSEQDLLVNPPWTNPAVTQYGLISATEGIDIALSEDEWAGGGSFTVVGQGGDPAALQTQVKAHEDTHAADNLDAAVEVLLEWDDRLRQAMDAGQTFPGPDRATAEVALWAQAGGTPNVMADRLVTEWGARSDAFHQTPAGETTVQDPVLDLGNHAVVLGITQP